MDNLELAEACGFMKHSEESGNDHTRVITYYECTADEINDFASRLTADNDAEIERLNALVAMQEEALIEANRNSNYPPYAIDKFNAALSASSETVSAWQSKRDNEIVSMAFELAADNASDDASEKYCRFLAERLRAKGE